MQDEQQLATKLQEACRSDGSGETNILGFGRVKVRKSERGSAKKPGELGFSKFTLTTAPEVLREPQRSDQSLAMGSLVEESCRLKSVRSLDCADGVNSKTVRVTAVTRLSYTVFRTGSGTTALA